ncbi:MULTISPECIES: pyridoxamine 5'-phosphate oxidase family protein [Glaesserella]|uniref:Pyridoxamine 5'-phosphate oxidase N-terminal domain-containing protein n=1 Tax=Glaesserella australis TaxID=2094024 RepID=A0A328BX19_9PAST|nr:MULTISPECIES: pyridoxamine 5'-phosphate oxidase family protein [Glaesserella]AUI65837.1 hypothetical protein CJD39_04285 [Glaesserella sp. 15-184]RAL18017.1 hypothetical protein C5N92_10295 [Glaesserella australis]
MANPIPAHIAQFIAQHHVVSLACHSENEIWAASCFYAFDEQSHRLIVLTKTTTEHGKRMLANPHIAGTIAGQPENIREIEGIQFQAVARCLENEAEKQTALQIYWQKHPLAKLIPSDVWEIAFTRIKHTENKVAFAKKSVWEREFFEHTYHSLPLLAGGAAEG